MIFFNYITSCMKTTLFYLCRIFPIKDNKIVVSNYDGKGFGDNGKYIILALLTESDKKKYDIVWLIRKNQEGNFPEGIRTVLLPSMKYIYELSTAKIWIDNLRKPNYTRKRAKQYYIQTWHGSMPLKKIEKDVENSLTNDYVKNAKNDSKMIDLILSGSQFCTELYKRAFWYNKDILECGSPRLDILINSNEDIKKKVYKKLNISSNMKILLYAPTFRRDYDIKYYNIDFLELHKVITKKFGGNWLILLRLHPNISKLSVNMVLDAYNNWLIDVSNYEDMYELLLITDVEITDYSSTMFEAALVNTPVFLYATDIDNYIDDRGFYFSFKQLPFSIASNTVELKDNIMNFDMNIYQEGVMKFLNNWDLKEYGNASKEVAKIIKTKMK